MRNSSVPINTISSFFIFSRKFLSDDKALLVKIKINKHKINVFHMRIFQLRTTNILNKMVRNVNEGLGTSGSKLNSSLASLVESVISNLGKAMKIGSANSYFTNQSTATLNTVCSRAKV